MGVSAILNQKEKMLNTNFDKNKKPQKFFERFLNNDLEEVKSDLALEYARIARREMINIQPYDDALDFFSYTKSLSTQKSREYNAFQFYYPWMHEIYSSVVSMVQEACEYYEIDYNSEQWMCQAWFNVNSVEKGSKLDWHDHVPENWDAPGFHGYYSVNAEPSETYYDVNGDKKVNVNKNNKAILSMVGFPHAMGDWDWPGDRITVAYDVMPLRKILQKDYYAAIKQGLMSPDEKFWEQHYFPLPKIYGNGSK